MDSCTEFTLVCKACSSLSIRFDIAEGDSPLDARAM